MGVGGGHQMFENKMLSMKLLDFPSYDSTHHIHILGVFKINVLGEIESALWIFSLVKAPIVAKTKFRALAHCLCPPLAYPLMLFLA